MAKHEIQILYGDARRAFDQIIERGENDDAAFDEAERDIAVIGVGGVLGRG